MVIKTRIQPLFDCFIIAELVYKRGDRQDFVFADLFSNITYEGKFLLLYEI